MNCFHCYTSLLYKSPVLKCSKEGVVDFDAHRDFFFFFVSYAQVESNLEDFLESLI
jgi:hypothetical protein